DRVVERRSVPRRCLRAGGARARGNRGGGVSRALPLADAAALRGPARRALIWRTGAGAVLAALLAALALATGVVHGSGPAPRSSAGVAVLALSGSTGPDASATIVGRLRAVAKQGGNAGLVLFSDATQEAVPPTAPASMLRGYIRFFAVPKGLGLTRNPWTDSFS